MRPLVLALFLSAVAQCAGSAERATVCAKYRTANGWSSGYKVEATIIKGSELNQATRSVDYKAFSTYVVIFWDDDQASVIEMGWSQLSFIGQEGEDKRGVKWEIAKTSICV